MAPKRKNNVLDDDAKINQRLTACMACGKACHTFRVECAGRHAFALHRKCRELNLRCAECDAKIILFIKMDTRDPFSMKRAKSVYAAWQTVEKKSSAEREIRSELVKMVLKNGWATLKSDRDAETAVYPYAYDILDAAQIKKAEIEIRANVLRRYYA
jgi:hypothetical protein